MNRRQFLVETAGTAAATLALGGSLHAQSAGPEDVVYVSAKSGLDSNAGSKAAPFKSLEAAAKRVNALTTPGATTVIVEEGIYALNETAVFSKGRGYAEKARLTIRAAVLPDDPDWHPGRMPTFIHTMPLSPNWRGKPDPFGGVAEGIMVETNHVTVQGLKLLGMPMVEHPKPGTIYRVYPIARYDIALDDLVISQCMFAGDEVTNPNHLAILVNGSRLVVDHCLFYGVKQTVVFWTPGSKGHAMRHCLALNSYATGVWTSGIASDFDFQNNVIANGNYVWIGQGARSASAEIASGGRGEGRGRGNAGDAAAGGRGEGRGAAPATPIDPLNRYKVRNSLFAGNKKFTGTGGGPALNFRDNDPGFLELIDTVRTDQPIAIELDQAKKNYLHPVDGSDAAKYRAGLFRA
jgi:hypothetical protein